MKENVICSKQEFLRVRVAVSVRQVGLGTPSLCRFEIAWKLGCYRPILCPGLPEPGKTGKMRSRWNNNNIPVLGGFARLV